MDRRWVGPDGFEIVPALREGRQVLRVSRHGDFVADCASVAEVARLVDLADLCEVIGLPVRPGYEGRRLTSPPRLKAGASMLKEHR